MERRVSLSAFRTAGLLAVSLAWALFLALTGSPEAVLFTLPVFLLAAPLAFGKYVGEDSLAALRRRPSMPRLAAPLLRLSDGFAISTGRFETAPISGRGPPVPSC